MQNGLKIESGEKLGKTIIFAVNHRHAKLIVERFDKLYPQYNGEFCKLIDNTVNYALDLINKFGSRDKMPQIAVSVDMLDTGIDVPDILNLVFFKAVRSKAKFWQMIGRGTRLSEDVFGPGEDKKFFLIFDICDNFGYFNQNPNGTEVKQAKSITQSTFEIKLDILYHFQDIKHQVDEKSKSFYESIKTSLIKEIKRLNKDNLFVRQKTQYVDKYSDESQWQSLTKLDIKEIKDHIGHLILPTGDEETAKRYDYLMLVVELSLLDAQVSKNSQVNKIIQMAKNLETKGTIIPQIVANKDTI